MIAVMVIAQISASAAITAKAPRSNVVFLLGIACAQPEREARRPGLEAIPAWNSRRWKPGTARPQPQGHTPRNATRSRPPCVAAILLQKRRRTGIPARHAFRIVAMSRFGTLGKLRLLNVGVSRNDVSQRTPGLRAGRAAI